MDGGTDPPGITKGVRKLTQRHPEFSKDILARPDILSSQHTFLVKYLDCQTYDITIFNSKLVTSELWEL